MSYIHSDPTREDDEHALPNVEIFELTSDEAAEMADEDTVDEAKSNLGGGPFMSSRDRDALLAEIRRIIGDQDGWYYQFGFPGCLPDSDPVGPFETRAKAIEAAQDD